MKKLLLLALVTIFTFSLASAQTNRAVFGPLVGDDAGDIIATNGMAIGVPLWVRTDPGNPADIVGVAHGLMTANAIIATRNGIDVEPDYDVPNWEQNFLDGPYYHNPGDAFPIPEEWTCEMQGALYTVFNPPYPGSHPLNTNGEWELYGTWQMVVNTGIPVDELYCDSMAMGYYPHSGQGTSWAFEGGGGVVPEQDYACIWISSNTDPVFTECPAGGCADAGMEICYALAGTDVDLLDDLHIVQTAGPGVYTEDVGGPGGATSGTWCWDDPVAGNYHLIFELRDNAGATILCEFDLDVTDITFEMECVAGFPGATVVVPVILHTCAFETGGIEYLAGWDPTVLELVSVEPLDRIDFGNEYFYYNVGDPCDPPCDPGGAVRVTWISDINNGVPHAPAIAGSDPVFNLVFQIDPAVPWGMVIPIEFLNQHYSDNTISDESGYIWWTPAQINGCVEVLDPGDFKGDPNWNGWFYEIGDAVLVARRLIHGYVVWSEDGTWNDAAQEASADLNLNGFVDVGDLVWFINIINDLVDPPFKVEPSSAAAEVSMPEVIGDNMEVSINAGIDVGGVLVSIEHSGVELGAPVADNGMDLLYHDADGVMNVVVFSMDANTLPAGNSNLFTIPVISNENGSMSFAEVSSADYYGRLMETVASLEAPLPTTYAVEQNYPNPFNARTQIGLALPEASDVTVDIYSVTGQLVESISGHYEAGNHSITWNAADAASGVYFYRVTAGDFSQTMKMTLLK
jgi:hypothetical protein